MEFLAERRYLNLPVKNGAALRRMRFLMDGATVREFDIELADGTPDFWVFLDLVPFQGRRVSVEVDGAPAADLSRLLRQDDAILGAEDLYREKHRPQFHFSSRRGWLNDPNGLVYHDGEYHLFYQHNPYGTKWGNMHWGHAVSADLVRWKELPIALYPQRYGDWCFSGSAVVDSDNTSGFRTGAEEAIVVAYTSTGRGECIAYSNDRGRTFTDFPGNPVVRHRGRDPKIIWHEPTRRWVMAVYHETGPEDREKRIQNIAFHTSSDLKKWEYRSLIEGYYECPEIFELPVDGNAANRKWVVYAADGAYSIGQFNGQAFTVESGKHRYNCGNCFYASQTFNDIPAKDGRRIQVAWGRIGFPGMPFGQMMLFPVELSLRTTDDGPRLFAEPVKEIERLYGRRREWQAQSIADAAKALSGVAGELFDIQVEFETGGADEVGLAIRGIPVTYKSRGQEILCKDQKAPMRSRNGRVRLRVLVDRASLEIFGNDGLVYMPMGGVLSDGRQALSVFSQGGNAGIRSLVVLELQSAWKLSGEGD